MPLIQRKVKHIALLISVENIVDDYNPILRWVRTLPVYYDSMTGKTTDQMP